jgi:Uma2 family endonuclease
MTIASASHTQEIANKITTKFADNATGDVVLPNISWQTYQAMLDDIGDRSFVRLVYDLGVLEIRMPSDIHEAINRLLARIVGVLATKRKPRALFVYKNERRDVSVLIKGVRYPFN